MAESFMSCGSLSASPLLWLVVTVLAYRLAHAIFGWTGMHPLANPVLLSAAFVIVVLVLTGTSYATYFDGARLVHFLIGPATVAMAIPLYALIERLKTMVGPLLLALVVGSATAIVSAVAIGWALGASPETLLALAPKSTTMPIAIGISTALGGNPSLPALTVMMTGIAGAVLAGPLLRLLRIEDPAIGGFATGVTSHAIGTAAAMRAGDAAGGFAALGMSLNGVATTLILPVMVQLVTRP
jgi:predicted murein hydrolase (TIGR00659 family)